MSTAASWAGWDVITGTLGKALGGASGGYISGKKEIIDLLRQRSRPYLFSNTLAPVIAAASITTLDLITRSTELRDKLEAQHRILPRRPHRGGPDHPARYAPDRARDARRRRALAKIRRAHAGEGRVRHRLSSTPSSRRARPASARRSAPPTAARTSSSRSRPSPRRSANWVSDRSSILRFAPRPTLLGSPA